MADFWKGFGQGFAPAYEGALARREREEKEEKAEKARAAAIELAKTQREEDRATAKALRDEMTRRWEAERETAKEKERGEIAALRGAEGLPVGAGVPTRLESEMGELAQAKFQREMKEKADKRMRAAVDAAAAQGYTPPPVGVRAPGLTAQDVIARGAEAKLAADIAKEQRAEAAAIKLKGITAPAKPKFPIDDVADEILKMQGQLGDKIPTQTREALIAMGETAVRRLHGGLADRLEERTRQQAIIDYKEKGIGQSRSTRGYKEAAEAGVDWEKAVVKITALAEEGKEVPQDLLDQMKVDASFVMAFYSRAGMAIPKHLEELVVGGGVRPSNTILTDVANAHELSMYGNSLAKDVKELTRKYGKEKMNESYGVIDAPFAEIMRILGIDADNKDRFIAARLIQKYQDMANYKLFIESGKTVTEQEFKRLKVVVGEPTREDFLEKLIGYAQLQTERTQRKLQSYQDAGFRFKPSLINAITGERELAPLKGLSFKEETQLKKYQDAKKAGLFNKSDEPRYRELMMKKLRE